MNIIQKLKHLTGGRSVSFLVFECFVILCPVLCTFFPPETYFSNASDKLYFDTVVAASSKPLVGRMVYLVLIAYLIYACYRNFGSLRKMVVPCLTGLLFIVYAMASSIWSGAFMISFTKAYHMAVLFLFLAYLYSKYGRTLTTYIVTSVIFVSAVLSIGIVFAMPKFGVETLSNYSGVWRGAFIQKNLLGENMSFGVLFSIYCAVISRKRMTRILCIASAVICGICLLKSSSATSLSSLFLALGFFGAMYVISKKIADQKLQILLYFGLAAGMLVAGYVASGTSLIFQFTGRHADFTGRDVIWKNVADAIVIKPIFGQGYAFWFIDSDLRSYIWSKVSYRVPHTHNTYLDLMLQLGVVGLLLYGALCITILLRSLREIRINQGLYPIFCLTILLMLLIRSITEVTLGATDQGIFWYGIPLLGLAVPRSSRRVKSRPSSGSSTPVRRRRRGSRGTELSI